MATTVTEYRTSARPLELRAAAGRAPKIIGYAAVFGQPSENLGGFVERIDPGAFDRALKEKQDVRALVDHRPELIIGRTTAGTLELSTDKVGLLAEITPPDTQAGRDILESVRRGDVSEMSFGFRTVEDSWRWLEDGPDERTLLDVDLLDVSAVTYAAYPQTSLEAASSSSRGEVRREAHARAVIAAMGEVLHKIRG